jgi:hypothetical protein
MYSISSHVIPPSYLLREWNDLRGRKPMLLLPISICRFEKLKMNMKLRSSSRSQLQLQAVDQALVDDSGLKRHWHQG